MRKGLPALRPTAYKRLAKNKKTVHRAYGGSRCAACVRDRIIRAFLIEEQKIVKKVLKAKNVAAPDEEAAVAPKAEKEKSSGEKKGAASKGKEDKAAAKKGSK